MDEQGFFRRVRYLKPKRKIVTTGNFLFAYPLEAYGVGIFTY